MDTNNKTCRKQSQLESRRLFYSTLLFLSNAVETEWCVSRGTSVLALRSCRRRCVKEIRFFRDQNEIYIFYSKLAQEVRVKICPVHPDTPVYYVVSFL